MADGNSEFSHSLKDTKVSRRDFLKLTGSGAALAALKAVAPIFPPESNSHPDIQKSVLEPTELKREPIAFPDWGLPLFKPLWPYMDEIGRVLGLDPKIIMGYMAMESKGVMNAVSSGHAHGLMQTLITPSEGWLRELKKEKRFPQIVESLHNIGIDIADTNGNIFPIVVNDTELVKSGELNLHGLPSVLVGAYKIARDILGNKWITPEDRAFIAHIPDNPMNHPTYKKLKQYVDQYIFYYLNGYDDLYNASVLGHIAPLNPDDPTKLSPYLQTFYNSGRIMGATPGGLNGSIQAAMGSQQPYAQAFNRSIENNPTAPRMNVPSVEKVKEEWAKVQSTYQLVK